MFIIIIGVRMSYLLHKGDIFKILDRPWMHRLRCGGNVITGAEGHGRFSVIASFVAASTVSANCEGLFTIPG